MRVVEKMYSSVRLTPDFKTLFWKLHRCYRIDTSNDVPQHSSFVFVSPCDSDKKNFSIIAV